MVSIWPKLPIDSAEKLRFGPMPTHKRFPRQGATVKSAPFMSVELDRSEQSLIEILAMQNRSYHRHSALVTRFANCGESLLANLVACVVVVVCSLPLAAQEADPFGTEGDTADTTESVDFGAPETPTEGAAAQPAGAALPPSDNIVVRMLREDPPKDVMEVARAIRMISRLKDWPEVGRYLDQLGPLVQSDEIAEELVRTYGSDLWIQLSHQPALSEPQRLTAKSILDKVTAVRTAPQTLEQAINGLKDSSSVERRKSAMRLHQAGAAGLKAIVDAVGSANLPASPLVVDLINSYGKSGVDALSAAITTTDAARRNRLINAAIAFSAKGTLPQLAAALYDPSTDNTVRSAIDNLIAARGKGTPTVAQVRNYLQSEIESDLKMFQSSPNDGDSENLVPLWLLDSKSGGLKQARANASTYYLQKASEVASALLSMEDSIDDAAVLAAAALLQRDYAIDQFVNTDPLDLRTKSPLGAHEKLFAGRASDWAYWVSVYRTAEVNKLYAAQLRAVQQIGTLSLQENLHNDVLNVLLDASRSTVPAVRYAALETLLKFRSIQGHPQVANTLITARGKQTEFIGFPTALVVGGSAELRQMAINQLLEMGIESLEASSGREAVRRIQRFSPFEFVLIVDRVSDMPISELVQRIAAYPPTSAISVAVLTPTLTDSERVVLKELPGIVYGTLTTRENYMASVLRRMNSVADIPLPSRSDRLVWTGMLRDLPAQ